MTLSRRSVSSALAGTFALLLLAPGAGAAPVTKLDWVFDSKGAGFFFVNGELQTEYPRGEVSADPGPGGLPRVLNYFINNAPGPGFLKAGDVTLCLNNSSAEACDNSATDILRFNEFGPSGIPRQAVYVYSNPAFPFVGVPGSPADTASGPSRLYDN